MKRQSVLKLMEFSFISPEDAFLLKEKLPEYEVTKHNWIAIIQKLLSEAINNERDDLIAFRLEFLRNSLPNLVKETITLSEPSENTAIEENFDDRLKWLSDKDKEKIKKAEEYIINKGEEELVYEAVDYIIKTYPDVLTEINRLYLDQAYKKYLKKIGVIHFFYLSEEPADILRLVNQNIDGEISRRKYEYERENINEYLSEYLAWAKMSNITKHTKQNIQVFLKQKGKKLMNPTIDMLKNLIPTL